SRSIISAPDVRFPPIEVACRCRKITDRNRLTSSLDSIQRQLMTLSDFATFSTAISGLAVTASLIYLALQTHQAAKHTKALIHQGNAARIMGMASVFTSADMVAAIIVGNGGTPSPDEIQKRQFGYWCMTLVVSMEDTFGQHEEGLISEDRFNSF